MKVSIVGAGPVGLVTGVGLAERGHDVVCVDTDLQKVAMINAGQAYIHEAGLPELLRIHAGNRLRASGNLALAVGWSDVTFIAVGTPALGDRIDLSYVERAAEGIGCALRDKDRYHTVVVKSTVIPGTTDGSVRRHLEAASAKRCGIDFGLGMNPEFLTEGTAVADFMRPDRLVLGGINARTHEVLRKLYAALDPGIPRIMTNNATAEMIKYASNAVLATLISFSNEIARLCSAVGGVDVRDVMHGVHQSSYFTTRGNGARAQMPVTAPIADFLQAGCGFGGSCLPKDVAALIGQGQGLGLPMPLLRSVLRINRGQAGEVLRLVSRHYPVLKGVPVAVLGLAFKPDTGDVRESPAFPIIRELRLAGARVTAYDPVAQAPLVGVTIAHSLREAVNDAAVVVLVTGWPQFRELPEVLRAQGRAPLVVDGRRMSNPGDYERYEAIGRQPAPAAGARPSMGNPRAPPCDRN